MQPAETTLLRSVRDAAARASSLEDALRAALERICAATGWQAGRVEFSSETGELASHIVWHVDRPERLSELMHIAEARRGHRGSGLAGKVPRPGEPQVRPAPRNGAPAVAPPPAAPHPPPPPGEPIPP